MEMGTADEVMSCPACGGLIRWQFSLDATPPARDGDSVYTRVRTTGAEVVESSCEHTPVGTRWDAGREGEP